MSFFVALLRRVFGRRASFNPDAALSHVFVDVDAGVDPALLTAMAPGLQAQLREDLAPEWGRGAGDVVRTQADGGPPRAGEVQIQLHADAPADEAGALAIHDKQPDGTPIVHVYAGLIAKFGASLSVAISHELLEARVDPEIETEATLPDGRLAAVEIADACEDEAFAYEKRGVLVSDFSTRSNFGIGGTAPPYDFRGHVKNLFEVLPGGYAQILDPHAGWVQLGTGMRAYRAEIARLGLSRGSKRRAK